MDDACDICSASEAMRRYLEVTLSGVLTVWIHRCERCGFRQVRPRLSRDHLTMLYPAEYFDSESAIGYEDYTRQAQRHEREAYFFAKQWRRVAPEGHLLEVGCALGFFLNALKRSAWEVEGLDVSRFAAYYAREQLGLHVTNGTLEEVQYQADSFDFIVQKDLLEHVTNPRRHLLETRRIMRPQGRLWIITPNGEANLRPLSDLARDLARSGENALPLLGQGHLSFFSKQHLLRLFAECGFECVRMRNIGIRKGLRALGFLPRKKKTLKTVSRAETSARSGATAEAARTDAVNPAFQSLAARITREIERRHRPIRSWVPYFYYRRFLKAFDSFPAPFTIGHDFDFVLQKT